MLPLSVRHQDMELDAKGKRSLFRDGRTDLQKQRTQERRQCQCHGKLLLRRRRRLRQHPPSGAPPRRPLPLPCPPPPRPPSMRSPARPSPPRCRHLQCHLPRRPSLPRLLPRRRPHAPPRPPQVAFVVRKAGSALSCTQVIEYVANQVSPYKKVRKVVFVQSIPMSAAGKVLRRLLKDSLRDDIASASSMPGSNFRSRL